MSDWLKVKTLRADFCRPGAAASTPRRSWLCGALALALGPPASDAALGDDRHRTTSTAPAILPLDSVAPRRGPEPDGSPKPPPSPPGRRTEADLPSLFITRLDVSSGIPKDVVRRVLGRGFGRYRSCYESGLELEPDLQGKVTLHFAIEPDARLSSFRDGGSTLPDAEVIRCIVDAVGQQSFPKPIGDWKPREGDTVNVFVELWMAPPKNAKRR